MRILKPLATIILLLLASSPALTSDKRTEERTRIFTAAYDKVWEACIASANENFVVEHSEKESGIFTFKTGISVTSAGFTVGVTLKKAD